MFNFVKLPELDFDLESITTEFGRRYITPSGEKYPSVTTILSSYNKDAIMEWRNAVGEKEANKISGRAARRGTRLHKLCEDYVNGNLGELQRQMMMPFDKMMFRQVKKLLDENLNNVYENPSDEVFQNILKFISKNDIKNALKTIYDLKRSGYSVYDIFTGFFNYLKINNN